MAAVAGSKGRLEPRRGPAPGVQIETVKLLLDGRSTPSQAASTLIASAALREIGIDTNMVCNLACQYCYLSDRREAQGSVPLDNLLSWCEAHVRGGVKLLAFIGKEPLADPRAVTMLEGLQSLRVAHGHRFRTGMVTNGTLVTRWLDRLEASGISYLDISIDGLGNHENALRGDGVSARILAGIDTVSRSTLRPRFATATVLTACSALGYGDLVGDMFARGVVTCFASPVLRFALSNAVSDWALDIDDLWRTVDRLVRIEGSSEGEQIIIDLPYKYSWALLRANKIPPAEIEEDAYEALYWQIPASSVFIKLNPFPYSYWRALRLTHDGEAVLDMDLAAHPDYRTAAIPMTAVGTDIFSRVRQTGMAALTDAITRFAIGDLGDLHERDLGGQHLRNALRLAA